MPFLTLPNGKYYEIPEGMAGDVAYQKIRENFPRDFPQDTSKAESGISAALGSGFRGLGKSFAIAGADIAGLSDDTFRTTHLNDQFRNQEKYKPTTLEEVEEKLKTGQYSSGLGSLFKHWGETAAQSFPSSIPIMAGARAGAIAGRPLGIYGTVGGALLGGLGGAYPTQLDQMLGRQVEEQEKAGVETPLERGRARLAAVGAGGLDVAETALVFGRLGLGKSITNMVTSLLGKGATETAETVLVKAAQKSLADATVVAGRGIGENIARGAVRGVVAEVPIEMAQQVIERWNARLPLLDDDAMREYVKTGISMIGPGALFGGVGGMSARSEAKEQVAAANAVEKRKAFEEKRATKLVENTRIEEDRKDPDGEYATGLRAKRDQVNARVAELDRVTQHPDVPANVFKEAKKNKAAANKEANAITKELIDAGLESPKNAAAGGNDTLDNWLVRTKEEDIAYQTQIAKEKADADAAKVAKLNPNREIVSTEVPLVNAVPILPISNTEYADIENEYKTLQQQRNEYKNNLNNGLVSPQFVDAYNNVIDNLNEKIRTLEIKLNLHSKSLGRDVVKPDEEIIQANNEDQYAEREAESQYRIEMLRRPYEIAAEKTRIEEELRIAQNSGGAAYEKAAISRTAAKDALADVREHIENLRTGVFEGGVNPANSAVGYTQEVAEKSAREAVGAYINHTLEEANYRRNSAGYTRTAAQVKADADALFPLVSNKDNRVSRANTENAKAHQAYIKEQTELLQRSQRGTFGTPITKEETDQFSASIQAVFEPLIAKAYGSQRSRAPTILQSAYSSATIKKAQDDVAKAKAYIKSLHDAAAKLRSAVAADTENKRAKLNEQYEARAKTFDAEANREGKLRLDAAQNTLDKYNVTTTVAEPIVRYGMKGAEFNKLTSTADALADRLAGAYPVDDSTEVVEPSRNLKQVQVGALSTAQLAKPVETQLTATAARYTRSAEQLMARAQAIENRPKKNKKQAADDDRIAFNLRGKAEEFFQKARGDTTRTFASPLTKPQYVMLERSEMPVKIDPLAGKALKMSDDFWGPNRAKILTGLRNKIDEAANALITLRAKVRGMSPEDAARAKLPPEDPRRNEEMAAFIGDWNKFRVVIIHKDIQYDENGAVLKDADGKPITITGASAKLGADYSAQTIDSKLARHRVSLDAARTPAERKTAEAAFKKERTRLITAQTKDANKAIAEERALRSLVSFHINKQQDTLAKWKETYYNIKSMWEKESGKKEVENKNITAGFAAMEQQLIIEQQKNQDEHNAWLAARERMNTPSEATLVTSTIVEKAADTNASRLRTRIAEAEDRGMSEKAEELRAAEEALRDAGSIRTRTTRLKAIDTGIAKFGPQDEAIITDRKTITELEAKKEKGGTGKEKFTTRNKDTLSAAKKRVAAYEKAHQGTLVGDVLLGKEKTVSVPSVEFTKDIAVVNDAKKKEAKGKEKGASYTRTEEETAAAARLSNPVKFPPIETRTLASLEKEKTKIEEELKEIKNIFVIRNEMKRLKSIIKSALLQKEKGELGMTKADVARGEAAYKQLEALREKDDAYRERTVRVGKIITEESDVARKERMNEAVKETVETRIIQTRLAELRHVQEVTVDAQAQLNAANAYIKEETNRSAGPAAAEATLAARKKDAEYYSMILDKAKTHNEFLVESLAKFDAKPESRVSRSIQANALSNARLNLEETTNPKARSLLAKNIKKMEALFYGGVRDVSRGERTLSDKSLGIQGKFSINSVSMPRGIGLGTAINRRINDIEDRMYDQIAAFDKAAKKAEKDSDKDFAAATESYNKKMELLTNAVVTAKTKVERKEFERQRPLLAAELKRASMEVEVVRKLTRLENELAVKRIVEDRDEALRRAMSEHKDVMSTNNVTETTPLSKKDEKDLAKIEKQQKKKGETIVEVLEEDTQADVGGTADELSRLIKEQKADDAQNGTLNTNAELDFNKEPRSSSTATSDTGNTVENVRNTLKKWMNAGAEFDRLVNVYPNMRALLEAHPELLNDKSFDHNSAGVTYNGRVMLVANRIVQGRELNVFVHEAGAHLGLDKATNFDGSNAAVRIRNMLATRVMGWQNSTERVGNTTLGAIAKAAVKRAGSGLNRVDEIVAYTVEGLIDNGVTPDMKTPAGGWLNMFKKFVNRLLHAYFGKKTFELTPQQLVDFAYGAAKMKLDEGPVENSATRFSFMSLFNGAPNRELSTSQISDLTRRVFANGPEEAYKLAVALGIRPDLGRRGFLKSAGAAAANAVNPFKLPAGVGALFKGKIPAGELMQYRMHDLLSMESDAHGVVAQTLEDSFVAKYGGDVFADEDGKFYSAGEELKELVDDQVGEALTKATVSGGEKVVRDMYYDTVDGIDGASSRIILGALPDGELKTDLGDFLAWVKEEGGTDTQHRIFNKVRQMAASFDPKGYVAAASSALRTTVALNTQSAARSKNSASSDGTRTEQEQQTQSEPSKEDIALVKEMLAAKRTGANADAFDRLNSIINHSGPRSSVPANIESIFDDNIGRPKNFWHYVKEHFFGLSPRIDVFERTGLAFEAAFVDSRAPAIEAIKKANKSIQAQYYMRQADRHYNLTAQVAVVGPLRLIKTSDGTSFQVKAQKGANLVDALEALNVSGWAEQDAINAATMYMAIKRSENEGIGIAKLNFNQDKFSEEKAAEFNKWINAPEQKQLLDAIEHFRDIYNDMHKGQIEFAVATGRFSKKFGAELLAKKDFIPHYRVSKEGVVEMFLGSEGWRRLGDLKNQPHLKELVGGDEAIMDVVHSSLQNISMLTSMSMKNLATKETAFALMDVDALEGRKGKDGKETYMRPGHKADPNALNFYQGNENDKGGNEWHVVVKDTGDIPAELIVRGMEGMSTQVHGIVQLLGLPAKILRKAITLSPTYPVRQLFRDSFSAWGTSGANFVPVLTPLKYLAAMFNGKSAEEFDLQTQGAIGGHVMTGTQEDMAIIARQLASGKGGMGMWLAKAEQASMRADASVRIAAYNSFREQGMNEMQASLMTMEMVNFNKRGLSPSMHMLNQILPFFNAQIQGLNVLIKAARGKLPMAEQTALKEKFMRRGMMLIGTTALYVASLKDDDQYKKATLQQRLSNFFVKLPGMEESIRIPIPFEFGLIFKAIPEAMMNAVFMGEKGSAVAKEIGTMLRQQLPGGGSYWIPAAVGPMIGAATNYSFFTGKDIESKKEQSLDPEERYREDTTEFSKLLGRTAGLSPVMADYFIQQQFGAVGLALAAAFNLVLESADKPESTSGLSKLPFIGTSIQPADGGKLVNDVYEAMDDAIKAPATLKRYEERGDGEGAIKYMEQNKARFAVADITKDFKKGMSEIKIAITALQNNRDLNNEQKQKQLEEYKKYRSALAQDVMRQVQQVQQQFAAP